MNDLNNVPKTGTFGSAVDEINSNFELVETAISQLESRTSKFAGFFQDATALQAAVPSPTVGMWADVGSTKIIYRCNTAGTWTETEETDSISASVNYSTIDNLTSTSTTSPLSAKQGKVLNDALNSLKAAGYLFVGVTSPSASISTPNQKVYYLAPAGTYTNFGSSYTVIIGSIGVFAYNGTSWVKSAIRVSEGNGNNPIWFPGHVINHPSGGATPYIAQTNDYDVAIIPVYDSDCTLSITGATYISLDAFDSYIEFTASHYISTFTENWIPSYQGIKSVAISFRKSDNPNGYDELKIEVVTRQGYTFMRNCFDTPLVIKGVGLTFSSGRYFFPLCSTDTNTFVFPYDGKSDYVRIDGLDYTSNNTCYFLMSEWGSWDIGDLLRFSRKEIGVKLSKVVGLKYIGIQYRSSENPNFTPETAVLEWYSPKRDNTIGISYTKETPSEILEGEFPNPFTGETIYNAAVNSYVFDNIDYTKVYKADGFAATSSGYTQVGFVHYYNDDTWLGIDEDYYLPVGPYYQIDKGYLNIPYNCNKILIVSSARYTQTPAIYEGVYGKPIYSQDLQDRIKANEEAINNMGFVGGKLMKVTKTDQYIYVRTALNGNDDIMMRYALLENNQYTWDTLYLGSKEANDSTVMGNPIQTMGDSTGAFAITEPAPWHLWAQHGYCIPLVTATHSLTSADIGSLWQDERNRQYRIGKVDGDSVYLLPVVRATEYSGVYTRDWKSPTTANNPEIESLTHVSGATHTSTISVTATSTTQLRPMMVLDSRRLLVDGKEITDNDTYYCDDFVISSTFRCTDPWTVQTWFPVTQVDAGAIMTDSFSIHGLSCRYDVILNMLKPYLFSWYGANQIQHFGTSARMSGYDVYGLMPRTKNYSVPYLVNDTTRNYESVYRRTADLYDINKMPDRYITYYKNATTGDMKIGCAGGYSLTRGDTRDSKRNQLIRVYQTGDRDCMSVNPSLRNKAYIKLITDSNFENGILPASFICQASTYLCYFDPMANVGQVYWYKDGSSYVVYAHYQEAHNKLAIRLPSEMDGLSATVVDKTDGVELITDIVENGTLYVSADSTNHNYIVLKVS